MGRVSSSLILFTITKIIAEIAQLVEHNLAKVRVASSSLVFRSFRMVVEVSQLPFFFLSILGVV